MRTLFLQRLSYFSSWRICKAIASTKTAARMYRALLFATLVLVLEARFGQSSCQDEEPQRPVSDEDPSFRLSTRNFLKRYNDIDYDSFVGLMGRRSADADEMPSQRKREMHDIFVGLMGRRSNGADTGRPWRREQPQPETRGLFFNKCRLRLVLLMFQCHP
ncbi:hypothetical protein AOLI_G00163710 [Acnodon oligacanthus]